MVSHRANGKGWLKKSGTGLRHTPREAWTNV